MQKSRGADRPLRVIVSNRSPARLAEIRRIHHVLDAGVPVDYVLAPGSARQRRGCSPTSRPGSLIVNATGLGKGRAWFSPVRRGSVPPRTAIVWDLNYRGKLRFLDQARAQASQRNLRIEDGWTYSCMAGRR